MSVVAAARPAALALAPGLFGKLPAHGDFVRRGWPGPTVAAIDDWLTATMIAARRGRDDAGFAGWMRAAPMWRGHVPAGMLGPLALRIALAPSIDRAGRLFPLVAGIAGADADVWARDRAAPGLDAVVDAAMYDAVAGRLDADAMLARIAGAGGDAIGADRGEPSPVEALWWSTGSQDGTPPLRAGRVDAALLEHLMGMEQA